MVGNLCLLLEYVDNQLADMRTLDNGKTICAVGAHLRATRCASTLVWSQIINLCVKTDWPIHYCETKTACKQNSLVVATRQAVTGIMLGVFGQQTTVVWEHKVCHC